MRVESCNPMDNLENITVGLVAVGLLIYLFLAMLRPEKF